MVRRLDLSRLASCIEQGYTVLVPNQRIRTACLHSYAQGRPSNSFLTPDINAIDIWIRNRWAQSGNEGRLPFARRRLLATVEEALIWLDIIDRELAENPLLNVVETAASAQHAYQLFRLWLDDGSDPDLLPPRSSVRELSLFRRWAGRFGEFCSEHQVISLADATHTLMRELAAGNPDVPEQIAVLNFYQPPPLYSRLFELLTHNRPERRITTAAAHRPAGAVKTSFPDFEHEARACAEWARDVASQDPQHHVGIIHPDDDGSLQILERVFRDVFVPETLLHPTRPAQAFNSFSTSTPILDSGLISDALLVLDLGTEDQDSLDFCRLLRSRFLTGHEEEQEQRLLLEARLRDIVNTRCTLSQLVGIMSRDDAPYHCPLLAASLLRLLTLLRENRKPGSPGSWARLFGRQLELMGWPGPTAMRDPHQQQLLQQWQNTLDRFAGLDPLFPSISREKALASLRTLLLKSATYPAFDSRCQVSFYTLNDAAGTDFTHTWFLGFSDQAQPSPPSPSPFLGHDAQRQAGIPGSQSQVQLLLARQALDIVCRSTTVEIRGSFHLQDGDEQFRESCLLEAFAPSTPPDVTPTVMNQRALADLARHQPVRVADEAPVPLSTTEKLTGGQAIVSDQSSCPFRAFARHRLRAESLEIFRNGLDARARGTATHIALEHLFRQIRSRDALQALDDSQLDAAISHSVGQAVDALQQRFPQQMTPRFSDIEKTRLTKLLHGFTELEKQRDAFDVVATESPLDWSLDQLNINLKIDRIDRLNDGSLAVIDYKTGNNRTSPVSRLAETRPENLQLPLYYSAASRHLDPPVNCVAIAQVNSRRTAYSAVAATDNFHPGVKPVAETKEFSQDWQTVTDHWQRLIAQRAADFLAGQAQVDPVNGSKTCNYCDLQPLCRIQELQPTGESDEGTES